LTTDTFTCDHCKQTFPRDTSDAAEEAVLAEAEKRFGPLPPEGRAVVCNGCYAKFIANLDRRIAEVMTSYDTSKRTLH
jgi:hypothetical protein